MCQNIKHNITVLFTLVFLGASKVFDSFNLYRKLLDRKTPIVIVRILLFWYIKQAVCVKWGRCISDYFSISNGVRQGRIFLLKYLFFNCINAHISNLNYNNILILKKNRI